MVAGARVAAEVFARVDPTLAVEIERRDGAAVQPGDTS